MPPQRPIIVILLSLLGAGCASSPSTDPRRRVTATPQTTITARLQVDARCPLPLRKNPARWFYSVALRMRASRAQLARAAHRAHRIRDVLLYACLNAKAKAATHVMGQVAAEHDALRRQTPPDPLVTRRILAYCEQVRQLVREARRCVVAPTAPRRPAP